MRGDWEGGGGERGVREGFGRELRRCWERVDTGVRWVSEVFERGLRGGCEGVGRGLRGGWEGVGVGFGSWQ